MEGCDGAMVERLVLNWIMDGLYGKNEEFIWECWCVGEDGVVWRTFGVLRISSPNITDSHFGNKNIRNLHK